MRQFGLNVHPSRVSLCCRCSEAGAEALTPRQRRLAAQRRKWEQEQALKPAASKPPAPSSVQQASHESARGASRGASPAMASTSAPSRTQPQSKPITVLKQVPQGRAPAATQQTSPSAPKPRAAGKQVHAEVGKITAALQPATSAAGVAWQPWSVFRSSTLLSMALLKGLTGEQLGQLALHWADEAAARIIARSPPALSEPDAPGATLQTATIWPLLTEAEQPAVISQVTALAEVVLARLSSAPAMEQAQQANQATNSGESAHTTSQQHGPQTSDRGQPALHPVYSEALSRQQHADIEWAVAHFARGAPAAAAQLSMLGERLHEAMAVPFRVLPLFLPDLALEPFMSEVALNRDVIYLDAGTRAVEEARLTGWQSDIGATFKYSGKEMIPAQGEGLSMRVARVRDVLKARTHVHYDSVLINLYENGQCGMRYHVDPLYGCWTPNSAVVSIGATRKFAFREAGDYNTRWTYNVRSGDVVFMYGNCQDRLQHAIIVDKLKPTQTIAGPRMSLVFKERIPGK